MGQFVVFVVLIGVFFVGLFFKLLCFYFIVIGVSFGLIYLFVVNKWELDGLFEELFKIFELFGFGVFYCFENRIFYLFVFIDDNFYYLDEIFKFLEECFKMFIENIICDFICLWYKDVGEGEDFIFEIREFLEMLCMEGYRCVLQIDFYYLVE